MPSSILSKLIPNGQLPLEEVSARGDDWYEKLRPLFEDGNVNRYVAIDVESGEYAIGRTTGDAMRAMHARRPEAQLFLRKIGQEPEPDLAARIFGGGATASPAQSRRKLLDRAFDRFGRPVEVSLAQRKVPGAPTS